MHGMASRSHLPRRVIYDLFGFSPKATSERTTSNELDVHRSCCCVPRGCINHLICLAVVRRTWISVFDSS